MVPFCIRDRFALLAAKQRVCLIIEELSLWFTDGQAVVSALIHYSNINNSETDSGASLQFTDKYSNGFPHRQSLETELDIRELRYASPDFPLTAVSTMQGYRQATLHEYLRVVPDYPHSVTENLWMCEVYSPLRTLFHTCTWNRNV